MSVVLSDTHADEMTVADATVRPLMYTSACKSLAKKIDSGLFTYTSLSFSFQTGTLTEEGLDMWGVVPIENTTFQPAVRNPSELPLTGRMATAMATCHSLTIIDNEITGDPLDLKMFNSINWVCLI